MISNERNERAEYFLRELNDCIRESIECSQEGDQEGALLLFGEIMQSFANLWMIISYPEIELPAELRKAS